MLNRLTIKETTRSIIMAYTTRTISSNGSITDEKIKKINKAAKDNIGNICVDIDDTNIYSTMKVIDLSMLCHVHEIKISTKTRALVKGLDKCICLKSLTYCGVRFESFSNNSLEILIVNSLYDDFDPSGLSNVKSIIINCDNETNLDVNIFSSLEHLEYLEISDKVTLIGKLTNTNIKNLICHGPCSKAVFNLSGLCSYQGNFNASILANSAESITFENSSDIVDTAKIEVNATKLVELTINMDDFALLYCPTVSGLVNLIINFDDVEDAAYYNKKTNYDLSNMCTNLYANVSFLILNKHHQFYNVVDIVNKFTSLKKLHLISRSLVITDHITCPIEHLEIETEYDIAGDLLKYFNKSKLSVLRCNVAGEYIRFDIPTLTELYCNEFILIDKNAANLRIYHGPVPDNLVWTNLEELECSIYYISNYDIDYASMPKLVTIDGVNAKEFIESLKYKLMATYSIEAIDDVGRIIKTILANYCQDNNYSSINNFNYNSSFNFVKSSGIKRRYPNVTIEVIVDAISAKLAKMPDNEQNTIVAIMNNIFKKHIYDEAVVIVEKLFTALDGKFGIIMDEKNHIIQQKMTDIQKQIDELKSIIA